MKAAFRVLIRPSYLLLLLLGVFSVRAVQGYPHDPLSSIHRLVTHPGNYLEDATYSMDNDIAMQQGIKGKRWWRSTDMHSSLQGKLPSQSRADIPSRFSDSGGFLQLCLLLLFCVAVMCCASMSITPWYKLDSFFPRKLLAGIGAALVCLLEAVFAKRDFSLGSKPSSAAKSEGNLSSQVNDKAAQPLQRSTKKAAKGKKRRTSYQGGQDGMAVEAHNRNSTAGSQVQPESNSGGLEETVSNASEESVVIADLEAGQTVISSDHDLRAPETHMTPVDAQIARIEAESLQRQMQRLAKQKKHATQAPVKIPESSKSATESNAVKAPCKAIGAAKPGPLQKANTEGVSRHNECLEPGNAKRKPLKSLEVNVKAFSQKDKEGHLKNQEHLRFRDSDIKDRPTRKPSNYERSAGHAPQVLLVPRRSLFPKNKIQDAPLSEEVSSDKHMAPHTPDRVAFQKLRSPMNSPQSLASPARPYAEVAREQSARQPWSNNLLNGGAIAPPPPPPPPRKLSALPKSAVYAQEFTPAALRHWSSPVSPPLMNMPVPGLADLSRSSAPPSLELPKTLDETENTSPFPGMSLHRKRAVLPVTGVYSNVLQSDQGNMPFENEHMMPFCASRADSSTGSDPSPVFVPGPISPWPADPSFSEFLNPIWSTSFLRNNNHQSWSGGGNDLVSEVSLTSSSDVSASIFGQRDPPLLAMGHGGL